VLVLVSIPEFTALILDFQNGDCPPSWILKFAQFLSKIQICAYFYVHMQNLVKIRRSVAELLRIFDFQKWRPPAILDLVWRHIGQHMNFDGPNILLKLHVDRVYTGSLYLQDIAIFIFGRFGLKLSIHVPFWGVLEILPPNEFRYCRNPQKDRCWTKTRRMSHKPWNPSTGSTWARARDNKIHYNLVPREKVTKP